MDKKFEITGVGNRRDFLNAGSAHLDNGEVKADIDLFKLRINLSQGGMSPTGIAAVMKKLEQYATQVETEKAKGIHLGSTSLASGLSGEIWMMPPHQLGLQTENEVKLVAMLVEMAVRESK